jgi:hypothetical protein
LETQIKRIAITDVIDAPIVGQGFGSKHLEGALDAVQLVNHPQRHLGPSGLPKITGRSEAFLAMTGKRSARVNRWA